MIMILRQRFYQRVFKEGWVLKRLVVIKSIKLGTTDGLRMNLAKKNVYVMSSPGLFTNIVMSSRRHQCKPDLLTFSEVSNHYLVTLVLCTAVPQPLCKKKNLIFSAQHDLR